MAKKKITQAKTKQKSKFSLFEDKHPLATAALMIAVLVVGFIGYNKFLDYRNVQDMKGLLSDFQQLERDIETETGEEFYIKASCSSNGQFLGFYSCDVSLEANENWKYKFTEYIDSRNVSNFEKNECNIADRIYRIEPKEKNFYDCSFGVRPSSQQKSEEIFYDYDTSPGWPL